MNRFFDNFPLFKGKVSGKITLSLFMLLYSMLLVLFVPCKDRLLCFIAMLFSSLGDFFLNHTSLKERTKKAPKYFSGHIRKGPPKELPWSDSALWHFPSYRYL